MTEKLRRESVEIVSRWDKRDYDNFKDVILDCRSLLVKVMARSTEEKEIERVLIEATTCLSALMDKDPNWNDTHGLLDPAYVKPSPSAKMSGRTKRVSTQVSPIKPTRAIGTKTGARCGLVDRNGRVVVEFPYFDASIVGEDIVAFGLKRYGRKGLCSFSGESLSKARFNRIGQFSNGLAPATIGGKRKSSQIKGGKYGFIGPDGTFAIEAQFEACQCFSDGLAAVNLGGENEGWMVSGGAWGFVNTAGEWVLPADGRFKKVGPFSNGLAAAQLSDTSQWCYINKQGEKVISLPPAPKDTYYSCHPFREGLARIVENQTGSGPEGGGKHWFLDQTGTIAIPSKPGNNSDSGDFSGARSAIRCNGKFGYIGLDGKIEIEPSWTQVYPFSEGLAGVRSEGTKTGFIDSEGTLVLPCQYKYASMFKGGVFLTFF